MFCVLGVLWGFFVIPFVTALLYALTLGRCAVAVNLPATYRRHGVERIIFSPDAALVQFGVRGTVIIERESESV
jgi:hypothetical protein